MIRDKKALLIFLTPPLAGFILFYLAPFAGGLYYTMTDNTYRNEFVGIKNFIELFTNPVFLLALKNTFIITSFIVPLILVISFTAAYFLKTLTHKRSLLRKCFILPLVLPVISIASIWLMMFAENGFINWVIYNITGVTGPDWFGSRYIYIPVISIYLWKYSGINIILFGAAFSTVPNELYDAAAIDGAGQLIQIRKITLPYIFPVIYFVTVLSIINSFKIFREAYVLCGSYPPKNIYLLQHFINNNFTRFNYGMLTSAAYTFSILVFILVFILLRAEKSFST